MKTSRVRLPKRVYCRLRKLHGWRKNWNRILALALVTWRYRTQIPRHSILAQYLGVTRRTIVSLSALLASGGFLTVSGHGFTARTHLSPSSLDSSPDSPPSASLRSGESLREPRRTESRPQPRPPEAESDPKDPPQACGNCRDGFDQRLKRCCSCPRGLNRAYNLALGREVESFWLTRRRQIDLTDADLQAAGVLPVFKFGQKPIQKDSTNPLYRSARENLRRWNAGERW